MRRDAAPWRRGLTLSGARTLTPTEARAGVTTGQVGMNLYAGDQDTEIAAGRTCVRPVDGVGGMVASRSVQSTVGRPPDLFGGRRRIWLG